MITLVSNDLVRYELNENASKLSNVLSNMIEEDFDDAFPIPIDSNILSHVVEYCEFFGKNQDQRDIVDFENSFYDKNVHTLLDILNAADFLDIPTLLDNMVEKIAMLLRGKTSHEIKELFGLEDITEQETEDLKTTFPWAFEN